MRNNYIITIALLSFLFFAGCSKEENEAADTTDPVITHKNPVITDKWAKSINSDDTHNIESIYQRDAIVITEDGDIHSGFEQIEEYYSLLKNNIGKIISYSSINTLWVNEAIRYEIGQFTTIENDVYKYFVLHHIVNGVQLRELEMISKTNGTEPDLEQITTSRDNWSTLCSNHDIDEFVSLYHENILYYTHTRPLSIGIPALKREYYYFEYPDFYGYQITPALVEPIKNDLVFEIGYFSAKNNAGAGKYLFVWKMDSNSKWKILLETDDPNN